MSRTPDGDIILIKINGKEYRTALYSGVQRFVPNAAVDFLVNAIVRDPHSDLYHELRLKFIEQEISLEDHIDFMAMCNGSLGHFEDSLSSNIDMNPHLFKGSYEELVVIENPLWD